MNLLTDYLKYYNLAILLFLFLLSCEKEEEPDDFYIKAYTVTYINPNYPCEDIWEYNKEGYLIKKVYSDNDHPYEYYEYYYDRPTNVLNKIIQYISFPDNPIEKQFMNKFNDEGKLTNSVFKDVSVTYEYDNTGRLVKKTKKENLYTYTYSYSYMADKLISGTYVMSDDRRIDGDAYIMNYYYLGAYISKVVYSRLNGDTFKIDQYDRDETGNILTIKDRSGNVLETCAYDEQGRCIEYLQDFTGYEPEEFIYQEDFSPQPCIHPFHYEEYLFNLTPKHTIYAN